MIAGDGAASGVQQVPRVDLGDDVTMRLRHEFDRVPSLSEDMEGALARLLRSSAHLPVEVVRRLLWLRAAPQTSGALLVTGLPVDDDLPPTPTEDAAPPFRSGSVSECAILSIAILLGEPVAYQGEKDGSLVQDVFPTRSQREAPSNGSSAIFLDFHTELTFSRQAPEQSFDAGCPDFVLLLGLRAHPERAATTLVIRAEDICRRLTVSQLAALRDRQFQLQAPFSFTRNGDGSRPWSPDVALLRGPAGAPSIAFDTACGVRALSPEAEEALGALRAACADRAIQASVQLGPGDLLVIDNNRCAHARGPYPAAFDGLDRWLLRAYVRRSIRGLALASPASPRVLL
jgi:L-asparagine oxygenase